MNEDTTTYTYTIFDSAPSSGGNCSWPSHEGLEIDGDLDEIAEEIEQIMLNEGYACGEYDAGYILYALIWDSAGIVQREISVRVESDEEREM
jgi:hypothetical protein